MSEMGGLIGCSSILWRPSADTGIVHVLMGKISSKTAIQRALLIARLSAQARPTSARRLPRYANTGKMGKANPLGEITFRVQ